MFAGKGGERGCLAFNIIAGEDIKWEGKTYTGLTISVERSGEDA